MTFKSYLKKGHHEEPQRIFWTLLEATVAKDAMLIKFLGVKFNFAKVSRLIHDLP